LRDFLTPALFRQVNRVIPDRFKGARQPQARWTTHPLLFVLLCFTWCSGDSQPERFETARAFFVATHDKRRRPGKTFGGFQKALTALPAFVLRRIAALFRLRLLGRLGPLLYTEGWALFGCDGSRQRCPHTAELEQRLGDPGGDGATDHKPPQLWLTVLVHLATGIPWSFQVGKGDASERDHLAGLVGTLPACALVVTDAGYQAYHLAGKLVAAGASFLMRVSSQTVFYTPATEWQTEWDEQHQHQTVQAAQMDEWTDGVVYYWPVQAQRNQEKPIEVRLIRIPGRQRHHDVWLVTDVLEQRRLSVEQASRYYRMRWENEGYFRTYKQTMKKVKLAGRTVKAVHREALGALLAVQVLLAQGAAGAIALGQKKAATSARQLLLLVRREMADAIKGRGRRGFLDRAAACQRDQRQRSTHKQKREWPGRQKPKPIKPPKIRLLDDDAKRLLHQLLAKVA
jgi:hypothetical protein